MITYMLLSVALNIAAQITLKYGLNDIRLEGFSTESFWRLLSSAHIWFGAVLYVFSFFIYLFALSKGELGRVAPGAQALTIIGVFLSSIFLFCEPLTLTKLVGVLILVIGAIVIFI
ncbi:hypothetical protein [Paenibacillus thiaminolyticus]|uniref:EamA family transporter n=1 Tax=Paenibacillus thiaminolyticus TaxID=49283 RepID=A0A3A3GM36_PANTH|nr:hypothetical protein [Paenibacillus thiaminolyticus]RJG24770.1 hypothetical protein DQX05_07935 [Paenibacillus thiaminolyticus]